MWEKGVMVTCTLLQVVIMCIINFYVRKPATMAFCLSFIFSKFGIAMTYSPIDLYI